MKGFFRSRGFKVLLAAVFIMLGLVLYTASTGNAALSSVFGFISTPMQQLAAQISGAASDSINGGKTVEELQAEVDKLTKERDALVALTVDYYDIKKNNEQYSKYLEIKRQNKEYQFAPGSVIGMNQVDMFYGFILDIGSSSGVEKNDPVITESGLVGWVSEVYPTYCKVTTILSPESSVGVIDQMADTNEADMTGNWGVVTGNAQLADEGLIKMGFISKQNNIKAGDIIITSGISGLFPRGLPVGKVVEMRTDPVDASSMYAVVEPYVDIPSVRDVFVITYFNGQGNMVVLDEDQQSSASSQPGGTVSGEGADSSQAAQSGASQASSGGQ